MPALVALVQECPERLHIRRWWKLQRLRRRIAKDRRATRRGHRSPDDPRGRRYRNRSLARELLAAADVTIAPVLKQDAELAGAMRSCPVVAWFPSRIAAAWR